MKKDKKEATQNIRAFALNEKSKFDDDNLAIRGVVISSGTPDSYGTTFNPAGIDTERFDKNPILLLNHNDWSGLPIGRIENILQEGDEVLADAVFEDVTKESKGKDVYNLLEGKFLNGFSVRFNALRWGNEKNGEHTFEEWELMEVSVVNIPSNPDAVVKRSAEVNENGEIALIRELETPAQNEPVTTPITEEVAIADVRGIVLDALGALKKVDNDKRNTAEIKEQFTTDLRAALVLSYKTIGKSLKSLKENKS